MPNNKKHHYVPRFYLKRFSEDGKSICLYNLPNKLKVDNANLRNQCYKSYFYGKGQDMEGALADLEEGTARLFSLIDSYGCLPPYGTPEHLALLIYILIQSGRTKYSADAADEMHDKLIKHVFREKLEPELKGFNLDDFIVGIKDVSQFILRNTIKNYPILLDLGYKLLKNNTSEEFVTSDNPVVKYNQLFSFRTTGNNSGLATKGLQMFFPISPDKLIVLYDNVVYRLGNDTKSVVEANNKQDVYNLNMLQMCSCEENIYFRDNSLNIQALHKKAKPYLRERKADIKVFPQEGTKMRRSEFIMNYLEDIR